MDKLQEILARDIERPVITQKQYQATVFYVYATAHVLARQNEGPSNELWGALEAIEQAQRAIMPTARNKAAAAAYFVRLARNVAAFDILTNGKPLSKDDARQITDFWTDTEIFDGFNTVSSDIQKALRLMLEYWQADKAGGFISAPELQRAAARAGDYGVYLERLIGSIRPAMPAAPKSIDVKRAHLRMPGGAAYNNLARWYDGARFTNFIEAIDDIYEALKVGKSDEEIGRKIVVQYDNINKRLYDENTGARLRRPSWKDFFNDIANAYGVRLTYYAASRLRTQRR